MKTYEAASIFLKYAQDPKQTTQLKKLGNILASPTPRNDLYSGLISTLQTHIRLMPENQNWPITSAASKSAVTRLYNAVKSWYVLLPKMDITPMAVQFSNVVREWNSYQRMYLTRDFLISLSSDTKNTQKYNFWYKLNRKISEAIYSIYTIQNDIQNKLRSNQSTVETGNTTLRGAMVGTT